MSVPIELLRARQKCIMLQRRQLEIELEAAKLEEEILMSTASREDASHSSTTSDQQAESAVYSSETATVPSHDLSETRGRGQDEERTFSTHIKSDNTRIPRVAESHQIQSSPNFEVVTYADKVQTSPTECRKVATDMPYDVVHNDRDAPSQRSNIDFGKPQLQTFTTSAIKSFEKPFETNLLVDAGAINTQQNSPKPGNPTITPSFFLPSVQRTHFRKPQEEQGCVRDSPSEQSPSESFFYCDQSLADRSPRLHHNQPQGRSTPGFKSVHVQAAGSAGAISNPSSLQHWQSYRAPPQQENTRTSEPDYNKFDSHSSATRSVTLQDGDRTGVSMALSQNRPAEVSQFSSHALNEQQTCPSSPKNIGAASSKIPAPTQPRGLGSCSLKKKHTVVPIQEEQSVSQVLEDSQDETPQNASSHSIRDPMIPRKRSSSITFMIARPAKRIAGEPARVITPPLNEDGEKGTRKDNTEQRPDVVQPQQHKPQPRSPSGSQYSDQSSWTSSTDSQAESDNASERESPRREQRQKRKTSMQQRIFPQITHQAYTLHLQGRTHEHNISSLVYPQPPPSPHPLRPTGITFSQGTTRPVNQQQVRQRGGALPMPASSSQGPKYRRLTPPERYELELRYCAHLARLLCSNTCVSSPPLPLCDENLWTRLHRRFPLQPGRAVPPRFSPDEVYTNAADFEVDVKAMLRQYVVLGHCGEQAQNQGQGRSARVLRCEFEKTGNARVMCWRMRLESILDEKLRQLRPVLRECEDSYEGDDMMGKRACIDEAFAGVTLGD